MPNTSEKKDINVNINILPGPATPAMKMAWRVLWSRLIDLIEEETEIKSEEKIEDGQSFSG